MIAGIPRFIAGTEGDLFVMEFIPEIPTRASILFFPPFAEEMNRSRRMVSQQAKILAANGYHVIIADLYGTGDSAGEFSDARWSIWKSDSDLIIDEYGLGEKSPVWFWGLRLGVLIAVDTAIQGRVRPAGIVAWSPVLSGEQFVNQLLRMRTMANMLADSRATETVAGLRELLASGESLEIGGYELAPELINEFHPLSFEELIESLDGNVEVEWYEMIAGPDLQPSPAIARIADRLTSTGKQFNLHTVFGPDFWTTAEIVVADKLFDATLEVFG